MKNKKSIYLLICCVVSVWGVIGYRIYAGIGDDSSTLTRNTRASSPGYFKLLNHTHDPYELTADYPDPFLGIGGTPAENVPDGAPAEKALKVMAPLTKHQINWSGILYIGYILNPQSKKRVGVFNINGKETMLSEGEESGGLKIGKFIGDSVKVRYQNANRFISIR